MTLQIKNPPANTPGVPSPPFPLTAPVAGVQPRPCSSSPALVLSPGSSLRGAAAAGLRHLGCWKLSGAQRCSGYSQRRI